MTQSRFADDFKLQVLSEVRSGRKSVSQVCREYGFTDQTFYNWRNRFSDLPDAGFTAGFSADDELQRLKRENDRLKLMVGDLSLQLHQLQQALMVTHRK
ncbi:transposase [Deinococcus roseus]|uniref:Transposase n=1 Tax=Deinococcus roseus TaxID=392414 RepID=A0ABQ2CZE7_9DEIO|nr:transposase [Deinococcus roseus]GGJ35826.1 transposase [Deinococcus roseus]